jgi:heat-inducible transcriptional repressor
MLSSRQKLVLLAIIEEYVKTTEPVGSKTLSLREELAFSSATLRNDMADLEDMGFLEKVHTSSGRVPSESGYKIYVEEILRTKNNYPKSFPLIDEIFAREEIGKDEAIRESMMIVSELTNYASLVLGSSALDSKIRRLQFVALNDRHAIILMVTDKGHVESKRIIVPDSVSVTEIEKVVTVLNDILYDCSIVEIDAKIKKGITNEDVLEFVQYHEDIINAFILAFSEMATDKYFMAGQSRMFAQPEFRNMDKVKELLDVIERKEILKVLSIDDNEISVRIGHENEIKAMQDCTVITVPYYSANGEKGAIAVFGPKRMEYQKVIPLLEYIARNMKKIT